MFEKQAIAALALLAASTTGASELDLEPCINGDVSPSGNFADELTERRVNAYLNWRSYEPYYLFAVSASYLESPFSADEKPGATR